jgi:membrane protein
MSGAACVDSGAYSQRVELLLKTGKDFAAMVRVQWLRGDPMLMGAAIAYNSLFALVPLTVAFVSMLHLLDFSAPIASRIEELVNSTLPPEVADFLIELADTSSSSVGTDGTMVLVVSLLIALWSGSRAVYAVQKSLRLVQAVPDDRGYLLARGVGVLVTVASGVSVLVGYSLLIFGETIWDQISSALSLGSISLAQFFLAFLVAVWVFGMLWAIYRFGPPCPVQHSAFVALVVEVVLAAGAWFAVNLMPSDTRSAVAAFGALGVILILFYFVGVTVVAAPILVTAAWTALSDARAGYSSSDEGATIEAEGSSQRSEPPRETSQ